jgi:predicted AAA+ superfamily ATPase
LALQIGSEISYTKLSKELGVSRDTVYNYITILEKSFIIFRITPYYTNKIKEITKTHKIYFYDNGIRNAVIRNFTDLSTRTDTGALFENYIFSEIQKIKLYGNGNYELNFWRTHNDSEVDIIKSFGDGKIEGIECKWNKEINPPLSFQKSYPNASFTCITKDNFLDFLINQNLQQKNQ